MDCILPEDPLAVLEFSIDTFRSKRSEAWRVLMYSFATASCRASAGSEPVRAYALAVTPEMEPASPSLFSRTAFRSPDDEVDGGSV